MTRIIDRFHQGKAEGGSDQSFHINSLDTTETLETEVGTQEHQLIGSFEMEMGQPQNPNNLEMGNPNQTESNEFAYAMNQWTPFDEQEEEKYDTFQEEEQNQYFNNDLLVNQETAQGGFDICAEIFPTVFQDNKLSSMDENEVFSWKDWEN